MKKLTCMTAALLLASSSSFYAGNLDTFEAPEEVAVEEAPMGGSNAAWIVPLIAIIAIAVASGGDDNGSSNGTLITDGGG